MTGASEAGPPIVPVLRPSEYTAALIQALQASRDRVRGARVLEIGSGSGIVLAALGAMGAAALCGVDIEPDAVSAGRRLLGECGLGTMAEFHRGDMWLPVAGRRFDLIVANLPHFPMEPVPVAGRLSTWSSGGADGRWLLDPFLEGLSVHLAPGGRAVLSHNAFVGLDRSRDIAHDHGLSLRIVLTVLVYIAEQKLARMTPDVLRAEEGRSLHRHGPYTFGEMHIVEIGAAAG
ncbi:methyltransferase domain-containing protein [Reyranella sp.]|uniref:methyltransferase domain-containing protein n=1 Tax=Reyranella sp. TaxID=1929291 RepID=UPI003D0F5BE8